MTLPDIVAAMQRPSFYPHAPAAVSMEQTHISYVFLAGDFVYKIKKPVRFTFLDFSTLEQRRKLCHEEVRLNRRLAPDVYLGVLSLCLESGELCLREGDDPGAIEYVVHMRRLPHDRLLDRLLDLGQVDVPMVEGIALALAEFHSRAACAPEITANGSPTSVWAILKDNYDNGRRFRGISLDESDDEAIQEFSRSFLDSRAELLRQRQQQGKIRECHGDLHSEHICLTDPLVIFDCIEFNTQFRYIDVVSDIAFLTMDLDYHGRPDLSQALLRQYQAAAQDPDVHELAPFYQCYRAYVRGKVDSLKSTESDVPEAERQQALAGARRHFELAYRYTWAATPALVVVCGLSGSGKTSVAERLARRTGFLHVNSDIVRKQLAGIVPTARPAAVPAALPPAVSTGTYESGIYSREFSQRTYAALLEAALQSLSHGCGVILDATFQLRRGREEARAIANQMSVPVLFVECECSPEETQRRLQQRQARADSPSDADWNVYLRQKQAYEPFTEGEPGYLKLDTTATTRDTAPIEVALRGLLTRFKAP